MKKTIMLLVLFITGLVAKSQTWKSDSLVYYSSAYQDKPDTCLVEDITIVIQSGSLTITKHNARFHAVITDTLPTQRTSSGIIDRLFKLRSFPTMYQSDTGYVLMMIMSYWDGRLIAIGLVHRDQIFIYHIVNELIDSKAWIRKR